MPIDSQANINLKTLKKILQRKEDKIAVIKTFIPDFEAVLDNKRSLSLFELNKVATVLKVNMVSLYLTPAVYEKAYEFYEIIHQCKELEEKVGFMNKFGIHFTKLYDDFLLEKARYCPYCGFKLDS